MAAGWKHKKLKAIKNCCWIKSHPVISVVASKVQTVLLYMLMIKSTFQALHTSLWRCSAAGVVLRLITKTTVDIQRLKRKQTNEKCFHFWDINHFVSKDVWVRLTSAIIGVHELANYSHKQAQISSWGKPQSMLSGCKDLCLNFK